MIRRPVALLAACVVSALGFAHVESMLATVAWKPYLTPSPGR